ncbi:hypothetical protein WKI65_38260 [Streptomyces sp. MS1.AVA.3]|uniref:hypothetical protein n=1 Tax=Streptomyces decoyicus TaxID=249567 RepID=UPI0030BAA531
MQPAAPPAAPGEAIRSGACLRHNHPFPEPVTVVWSSAPGLAVPVSNYLYADAYRVTPPPGIKHGPQLWRGVTVRSAVQHSTRRPPVGWPEGYTTFRPDGRIEFTGPGHTPWAATVPIWSAGPTAAPDDWGSPCVRCGAFEGEHCSWCAPWLWRNDGTSCVHGSFTPAG